MTDAKHSHHLVRIAKTPSLARFCADRLGSPLRHGCTLGWGRHAVGVDMWARKFMCEYVRRLHFVVQYSSCHLHKPSRTTSRKPSRIPRRIFIQTRPESTRVGCVFSSGTVVHGNAVMPTSFAKASMPIGVVYYAPHIRPTVYTPIALINPNPTRNTAQARQVKRVSCRHPPWLV